MAVDLYLQVMVMEDFPVLVIMAGTIFQIMVELVVVEFSLQMVASMDLTSILVFNLVDLTSVLTLILVVAVMVEDMVEEEIIHLIVLIMVEQQIIHLTVMVMKQLSIHLTVKIILVVYLMLIIQMDMRELLVKKTVLHWIMQGLVVKSSH